jgi:hypothetical protein
MVVDALSFSQRTDETKNLSFDDLLLLVNQYFEETELLNEEADKQDVFEKKRIELLVRSLVRKSMVDPIKDWKKYIRDKQFDLQETNKINSNEFGDLLKKSKTRLSALVAQRTGGDLTDILRSETRIIRVIVKSTMDGVFRLFPIAFSPGEIITHTLFTREEAEISTAKLIVYEAQKLLSTTKKLESTLNEKLEISEEIKRLSTGFHINIQGQPTPRERMDSLKRREFELSDEALFDKHNQTVNSVRSLLMLSSERIDDILAESNLKLARPFFVKKLRQDRLDWERTEQGRRNQILRTVQKKSDDLISTFIRKIVTEDFAFFPPGEKQLPIILRQLTSWGIQPDYEGRRRLERITEEFPSIKYIHQGNEGFNGYVVFEFENTNIMIAEKFFLDNATYLLKGNWEDIEGLLKLSRLAVRKLPQSRYVFHYTESQWVQQVKDYFYTWH